MLRKGLQKVKQKSKNLIDEVIKTKDEMGQDHDKYKTLMQVVKGHNYPIERFFYTTEDGYICCLFRINGPKGTKLSDNRGIQRPVILY